MKKVWGSLGIVLVLSGTLMGCTNTETEEADAKEEMRTTLQRAVDEVESDWETERPYETDENYTVVGGGVVNAAYSKTGNRERVTIFGGVLVQNNAYREDYELELDEDGETDGHDNGIERYFVRVMEYENSLKVKDVTY